MLERIKKIKKSLKAKKKIVFKIIAIILVVLFLWLGKSLFIAAWAGGRPIYRLTLVKNLEIQGGQQVLDNLIEESLIAQEARKIKANIQPSDIDVEVKKIEDLVKEQGLTLEEALSTRNQTLSDLKKQIKLQLMLEKILSPKITISDNEIKDYYTQNKSFFGSDSKFEDLTERIKEQIFQQKLSEEYRKWMDDLKAKAKIFYFVKF